MDDKEPLLSDDEFVKLMEAQYQDAGEPVDEVTRIRLWLQLKRRIRPVAVSPRPWVAIALFLFALAPLVWQKHEQRLKGPEAVLSETTLKGFLLKENGGLEAITSSWPEGGTLVFKVSSPRPIYVALASSADGKTPEVRFIAASSLAGDEVILKDGEEAYGFVPDAQHKTLTFCLIAAEKLDGLEEQLAAINTAFAEAATCLKLVK